MNVVSKPNPMLLENPPCHTENYQTYDSYSSYSIIFGDVNQVNTLFINQLLLLGDVF